MLFLMTLLMSPFFFQEGMIIDDNYIQEVETDDDGDESSENSMFLLACNSQSPSGRVMAISHNSDNEDDDQDTGEDENIITEKPIDGDSGDIQEVDYQRVNQVMERELAESHMIQLASAIATDMGIEAKIVVNR